MTYPLQFRQHLFAVIKREGLSHSEAARRFGIGLSSLRRWAKKIEPQSTRNKPATKIDMVALAKDVQAHPDAYQFERAQRFGVSARGIGHALRRLGVRRKKNMTTSQSQGLPKKNV